MLFLLLPGTVPGTVRRTSFLSTPPSALASHFVKGSKDVMAVMVVLMGDEGVIGEMTCHSPDFYWRFRAARRPGDYPAFAFGWQLGVGYSTSLVRRGSFLISQRSATAQHSALSTRARDDDLRSEISDTSQII